MKNQIIIVGKMIRDPELKLPAENRDTVIVIGVQSNEGKDFNYITCLAYNATAEKIIEYCHKDDIVGIEGHIASPSEKNMTIVVDKVNLYTNNEENN